MKINLFSVLIYRIQFGKQWFWTFSHMFFVVSTKSASLFWNLHMICCYLISLISWIVFLLVYDLLLAQYSLYSNFFFLELDWFPRYHPQTQLLRLVAVDSVSKQSYKPLQIASNRSEPLKIKSWFQLAFAVAGGCGRIIFFSFSLKTI